MLTGCHMWYLRDGGNLAQTGQGAQSHLSCSTDLPRGHASRLAGSAREQESDGVELGCRQEGCSRADSSLAPPKCSANISKPPPGIFPNKVLHGPFSGFFLKIHECAKCQTATLTTSWAFPLSLMAFVPPPTRPGGTKGSA